MPIRRVILVAAPLVAALAWMMAGHSRNSSQGTWNVDAIRASLEMVVPAHNDASFRYVLENRTDSDYRIANDSEVKVMGRNKSTGELMPKVGEHISGEFPLWVPARRKVHFALVWTADQEIDPARLDDFVGNLNVRSFVLFDQVRQYEIELPASR